MPKALAAITFMLVLGVVSVASAQEQRADTPEVLSNVFACRTIADGAERLVCFDRAVGGLQQAEQSGQMVAVDRAQAREIERDSFGFSLPSLARLLPNLSIGDDPEMAPVDNLEMQVANIRERGYQRYVFTMENGQVWASSEPINANDVRHFRAGRTVTIRNAAMGSFQIVAEHGRAHRVNRER